jgi:2-amino-4-hydroxy-6-hydroxymethyldihydropteridine diphosphokinase
VSLEVSQGVNLWVHAFIGVGANLGDARATVSKACRDVGQLPSTKLLSQSSLYASAPHEASGPDFVNAVVEISTTLSPQNLLDHLHQLEANEARTRPYRNAPRTLDLDILLYGDQKIQTLALTVPHPRMSQRAFVLVPLAEIAPERVSAAQLAAVSEQVISRLR